ATIFSPRSSQLRRYSAISPAVASNGRGRHFVGAISTPPTPSRRSTSATASSSCGSHAMLETASRRPLGMRATLGGNERGDARELRDLVLRVRPIAAKQWRVLRVDIVPCDHWRELVRELDAKRGACNVGHTHRLRRQVNERKLVVHR